MLEIFLLLAQSTPAGNCHPSYPDHCLPLEQDVNYSDIPKEKQPVRIISTDDYGLDYDGDGWGCDKKSSQSEPDTNEADGRGGSFGSGNPK